MKLREALDIAEGCCLDTVEEAYLNVKMHAASLFSYDGLAAEIDELTAEYEKYLEAGLMNPETAIKAAMVLSDKG